MQVALIGSQSVLVHITKPILSFFLSIECQMSELDGVFALIDNIYEVYAMLYASHLGDGGRLFVGMEGVQSSGGVLGWIKCDVD